MSLKIPPGKLLLSETNNVELAKRNILVHPPEPPAEFLMEDTSKGLYVGRTDVLSVPFFWNPSYATNPHIAIVGISGSGKSYFIKTLLIRASFVWGANAIIIDWAGEYKDWVLETGGKLVALGKGNYLNLLDLGGMRPYDRIKQVLRTLEILTDIAQYPEQKRLTEQAIEEAYVRAKFKLDSRDQRDELGNKLEAPTLKDVVKILEEMKQLGTYQYPAELDNAIHRIKSFTREGEDYFAQKSTVNLDEIVSSGLVDLDLTGLPDENARALGALTMLQFIKEKMRLEGAQTTKGVKLITVLDEAWKIAGEENSDVVMIVREGRKYNFSLIIASQNPTDINQAIFSNVGTTFILKTKFENYLDYLQGSLRFSNYMRKKIMQFGVGQTAVNIAFHTPLQFAQTFIIHKIEGEEPIKDFFITFEGVEGVAMAFSISIKKNEFRDRLRRFGLAEEDVQEITSTFEKSSRRMNVIDLALLLEKKRVDRRIVVDFLKEMGVDDATIINIFTKVDFKKSGKVGKPTRLLLKK
ncbi:MAG: ATP-binding protein [Methanobacteriota archaeon]|nr:MAG: ATP-binding protein [Euryarchaeota archaeon]